MNPDALGKPGEGVHFHIMGIAVVDLALTIAAAYALARWQKWSFVWTFVALMVLGVLVHAAIGVRTTLTKAVLG